MHICCQCVTHTLIIRYVIHMYDSRALYQYIVAMTYVSYGHDVTTWGHTIREPLSPIPYDELRVRYVSTVFYGAS